mmetsp:Transcript_29268/g.66087  ORF Transcript_29268/g.66087 Transcript_29268/m.66087 type:complete len:220 (+) Transcript_29268:216-875(+)
MIEAIINLARGVAIVVEEDVCAGAVNTAPKHKLIPHGTIGGDDILHRECQVLLPADHIHSLHKLIHGGVRLPTELPKRSPLRCHEHFCAIIHDRHAFHEEGPGQTVLGPARLLRGAHFCKPVHVVVVYEIAKEIKVLVKASVNLLGHAGPQRCKIQCGKWEPLVAECGIRNIGQGEVQHTVERPPPERRRIRLEGGVEGHVQCGGFAQDGHFSRLLQRC